MHVHHRTGTKMAWPFDRPERYDWVTRKISGPLYRRVAAAVAASGLPPGSRVLDVGTGPGRLPLAVAAACPDLSVEGLDLSADMIATARRLAAASPLAGRVSYVVADVADMPYPDDSFDLVVSTLSQHHWPDVAASFRELRRVIRPGGRLWIYDARFALREAEAAAREAFPQQTVRVDVLGPRWLPIRPLGRLVVQRGASEREA